ncbi:C-C motif chemokine 6-like [Nannospalax galili]|uniref:C-C motif chemokine 6-like n=1 Tax=Nannospalax galili TaxID=1026970 RepID=UPI00081A198B|nr:C-C motif chemokine 6-like [Nannospalax galili]
MKGTTAVLSFLILVTVLGSQARIMQGVQDSSDCCFSYMSRRIRCSNFVDYFPTSGGCIHSGVIFVTNTGKRVCAKPSDLRVQKCMLGLRSKAIQKI